MTDKLKKALVPSEDNDIDVIRLKNIQTIYLLYQVQLDRNLSLTN